MEKKVKTEHHFQKHKKAKINPNKQKPNSQLTLKNTAFSRGLANRSTNTATHLTLNHGFPLIRLILPGAALAQLSLS